MNPSCLLGQAYILQPGCQATQHALGQFALLPLLLCPSFMTCWSAYTKSVCNILRKYSKLSIMSMLYILKSLDLEVCNNKIPLFCSHLLETKTQTFYFPGNVGQRESNRHRTGKKRIFCRQILELLNDTQAYYLCPQCSKAPDFIRKKKKKAGKMEAALCKFPLEMGWERQKSGSKEGNHANCAPSTAWVIRFAH